MGTANIGGLSAKKEDNVMNLRQLTSAELGKAHEAAAYLCRLPVRLDPELAIKLDTFRADVTVEIEDHGQIDLQARWAATVQAGKAAPR